MPFYGQAAFAAERSFMEFFNSAIGVLQTLVIALGAGLGIWGVALIGTILVPLLSGLFG